MKNIQLELEEIENFTNYLKKCNINVMELFKHEHTFGEEMENSEFKKRLFMFRRNEKIEKIKEKI